MSLLDMPLWSVGLRKAVCNSLISYNLHNLRAISEVSDADLMRIPGIGKLALTEIRGKILEGLSTVNNMERAVVVENVQNRAPNFNDDRVVFRCPVDLTREALWASAIERRNLSSYLRDLIRRDVAEKKKSRG